MTLSPRRRLRARLFGLVAAALLAWSPAALAQDASAEDAGPDDDAFEHRIVAYDPQRSMGYGGCDVGARPSGDASGCGALLALALATGPRRRREP